METTAGRGGRLCVVNSLAQSGPGTLREALELPDPRTIVFAVAGTIDLVQPLVISHGNVRIAGQTAPAPGITIVGAGLVIAEASDVVLQHLRIRVGDRPLGPAYKSRDGLQVYDAERVIVDHCSISWATDENVDVWQGVVDMTIRNCVISEGLVAKGKRPEYPDGHSCGMRLGPGAKRVLIDRCYFAHNNRRSPLIAGGCQVVIGNCLIYDPGSQAIGIGGADGEDPILASIVRNVFVRGRSTPSKLEFIRADATANHSSLIFAEGNVGPAGAADGIGLQPNAAVQPVTSAPIICPGYSPMPAVQGLSHFMGMLFADVGARPSSPDATDVRVMREATTFAGSIINSQADREGLPIKTFPDPNSHSDPTGYSDLEVLLNARA
jgi:hypothetical protein